MSFPTKIITCDCEETRHTAEVRCVKVAEQPSHVYEFTATITDGERTTSYSHRMTVGPIDGPFIDPTQEQLQKDVDAARQMAAKHCHLRHVVKELEHQIQ